LCKTGAYQTTKKFGRELFVKQLSIIRLNEPQSKFDLRPKRSVKRFQRSAIEGIRQKKNLIAKRWKVRQKTKSLTKSVGLVRRSGASANERKKNPALFSFFNPRVGE